MGPQLSNVTNGGQFRKMIYGNRIDLAHMFDPRVEPIVYPRSTITVSQGSQFLPFLGYLANVLRVRAIRVDDKKILCCEIHFTTF